MEITHTKTGRAILFIPSRNTAHELLTLESFPPFGPWVRIRITGLPKGSIDGIQLNRFRTGRTYDVSAALASYLMCERLADLVMDGSSEDLPLAQQGSGLPDRPLSFTVRSLAADRSRKKPRPRGDRPPDQ